MLLAVQAPADYRSLLVQKDPALSSPAKPLEWLGSMRKSHILLSKQREEVPKPIVLI